MDLCICVFVDLCTTLLDISCRCAIKRIAGEGEGAIKNPIQGRVTPHFASHGLARGTTGCDINSTDIVRPEFI